MDISELLAFSVKNKASDLHLSAGLPPMIRVHGDVRRINLPPLEHKDVHAMIYDIMNDSQRKHYDENLEVDFSFDLPGLARFRVNAFNQDRGAAAVLRTIPSRVLSLEELNCPRQFADFSSKPRGLVLVTGPTGSGKSTTLAAMVDHVNNNLYGHVLTIEDPIEFVHESRKCVINQREVGPHTLSLRQCAALGAARGPRRDPGRRAARPGDDPPGADSRRDRPPGVRHLHTSSAAKTIDRIVDVFPAAEKEMVRAMLSESLVAVISQSLLKLKDGSGRVAAHEIMVGTPAIRNLIRENKVAQMYSMIQTGSQFGMQTLDQCCSTWSAATSCRSAKQGSTPSSPRRSSDNPGARADHGKRPGHRFVHDLLRCCSARRARTCS
jgi:twitching motility protein PilT